MRSSVKRFVGIIAIALLLLAASSAAAEISLNLHAVKEKTRNGLVKLLTYVDDAGVPTVADDLGYASVRYEYSAKSKITLTEFLDAAGNRVNGADGYAYCTQTWNSNRSLVERAYFDINGQPALGAEGYARELNRYSGRRLLYTNHYGTDGELLVSDTVFARYVATYAENKYGKNKLRREEYFDAAGQLQNNEHGYAAVAYEYVAGDTYRSRISYLDKDLQPVFNDAVGYATMEKKYEKNRFRQLSYYDENGAYTMNDAAGYAYVLYEYEGGALEPTKEMFFDEYGEPCLQKGGYYGVTRKYDQRTGIRPTERRTDRLRYRRAGYHGRYLPNGYTDCQGC